MASPPTQQPPLASRLTLRGKRACVTGGNRGLGEAITLALAQAHADVAVVSRSGVPDSLREAVESCGVRCVDVRADLGRAEDVDRAADEVLKTLGVVDVLVNNAGVALLDPLLDLTIETWDTTMAINVRAPFQFARKFAPVMIGQRSGKIINISSQASLGALKDHGVYCASKAALNMLTKMMTLEWSKHNIQANAIAPTVIMTDMGKQVWGPEEKSGPMLAKIPLGRFGEPIEVADAVLFLASDASNLITGQVLALDGGYTAV